MLCLIVFSLNAQTRCGNSLDLKELRKKNPAAYKRLMNLEQFTNDYRQKLSNPNSTDRLIDPNALITIPVVVHVVHNGTPVGVGRNIPDAQIINQINILNEDFRRLNADMNQTPAALGGVAADAIIEFRLACINPNGGGTNGINRINSPAAAFLPVDGNNDSPVKHTVQGGLDAWVRLTTFVSTRHFVQHKVILRGM